MTINGKFFERESPGIAGLRQLSVSAKGALMSAVAQAPEKKPPPPPKKELKPEEMGTCTLQATGAIKKEQTSMGGRQSTNVSYWMTEAENKSLVEGFVVHSVEMTVCTDTLAHGLLRDARRLVGTGDVADDRIGAMAETCHFRCGRLQCLHLTADQY